MGRAILRVSHLVLQKSNLHLPRMAHQCQSAFLTVPILAKLTPLLMLVKTNLSSAIKQNFVTSDKSQFVIVVKKVVILRGAPFAPKDLNSQS
jgi:hypothetical protein